MPLENRDEDLTIHSTIKKSHQIIKPAIVTVGDEIILAERTNDNQNWMLHYFSTLNYPVQLALSVGDDIDIIAMQIKFLLDQQYYPIIVSGGIGGTHDDVTRDAIAKALDVALILHPKCDAIMLNFFKQRYPDEYKDKYTAQMQRMAFLPKNCSLIKNPIGAPGFHINGVFVFPGFPSMLKPMLIAVLDDLLPKNDQAILVEEYDLAINEGSIALMIEEYLKANTEASVGIYPDNLNYGKNVMLKLRYKKEDTASKPNFEKLIEEIKKKFDLQ